MEGPLSTPVTPTFDAGDDFGAESMLEDDLDEMPMEIEDTHELTEDEMDAELQTSSM